MTYRSRKHLDLAHAMPCMVSFPHACNQANGVYPMHSNWQKWGRGVGHKAPDWAWAAGCDNAHRMIDPKINPRFDREERESMWLMAFIATQDWLWSQGKVRVA